MKDLLYIWAIALASIFLTACDDDDFTLSPSAVLTFSADTVKVDTVFSNTPSAMRTFWAYNRNGSGLRCTSIRLERGNQSGFRVNVQGTYLGPESGYQTSDVELRKGDSLRVFVEVTPARQNSPEPTLVEDNLLFTLESGQVQKVNLQSFAWNATLVRSLQVTRDTTLAGPVPIVIQGNVQVAPGATLTLAPGTTLYFHGSAGMEVGGCLKSLGTADEPVTLRGDRIDHMFDYLPYDRVSGQWHGIHFAESSYGNELVYTDLHGAFDGIVADSADVTRLKLSLINSTVHNSKGVGVSLNQVKAVLENSQITNSLRQCVSITGGDVSINQCTIAQFYPFDGNRGAAFAMTGPLVNMLCQNTLITGYADDEMMITTHKKLTYRFADCIIRTPKITTADSVYFTRVVYEDIEDTTHCGRKHFARMNTHNLIYDFGLDSLSSAIGRASQLTALPHDRLGRRRDEHPDIGAYEYFKP